MPEYASTLDVRAALSPGAETSDTGTASDLPDWQLQDAIDEAQAIVDGYLNNRYQIPVSDIDVVNPNNPLETWVFEVAAAPVRSWTRDIAAYLATLTYRRGKDLGADDPIRLRYGLVRDLLGQAQDGTIILPFPTNDTDVSGRVEIFNLYDGVMFTLDDLGLGTAAMVDAQRLWRADTAVI